MYLELEPKNLKNLEKKIKSKSQIIRYLILTSVPAKPVAPKRRKLQKPMELSAEIARETTEKKPKEVGKVGLTEIDKKIEEILKE